MREKMASILIATQDEPLGWMLAECLRLYYHCETSATADEAAALLRVSAFNLVMVDVDASTPAQLEFCRLVTGVYPQTQLLIILDEGCLRNAIKVMAGRPFTHLIKPVDLSQVLRSTRRALWAQARIAARPSRLTSLGDEIASGLQPDSDGRPADAAAGGQTSGGGKSSRDRRVDERVDYLCEVKCEGPNDRPFTTRMNDISVGGAFIDSMISMRVGSMLKLNFRVRSAEITAMAEVRYSVPQVGMGIRFVDLSPEHGAAIAGVVGETSHTALSQKAAGKARAARKTGVERP